MNFEDYDLIGMGEFAHGIEESWMFRFKILKRAVKLSDKNIVIFLEQSVWQAENVMNNTYYDRNLDTFVKTDSNHFKEEDPYRTKDGYIGGKFWQYVHHSSESSIVMKIFKFIRNHKDKIKLIGVDNDELARDSNMFKIIMKNIDRSGNTVNFFWAHNAHVADREISDDTYHWIKDTHPDEKWFCGHYLKSEFRERYCIILSQAYEGDIRFNGSCSGAFCEKRAFQQEYFTKSFVYPELKHLIDRKKKYILIKSFYHKFLEYSNSYYLDHRDPNFPGHQELVQDDKWDFVLFWNRVTSLK